MLKFVDNNKAMMLSGDPIMDPGFDEYDIIDDEENKTMTKTELKELMDTYCLIPMELDDVINFVCDLLYKQRKEIEAKEPYAVRTINDLENAEHRVYELLDYISELEEK